MFVVEDAVEDYAREHTHPEPELLQKLTKETYSRMLYPQMLTGRLEGRSLKMWVQMIGAKRVLEIGTFTGYSALSMAEGLPEDGELITCEVNPEAQFMAEKYFKQSPHGAKIKLIMGPALDTIASLEGPFDFAFVDAHKMEYLAYYETILPKMRPGGIMAIDNTLWYKKVLDPKDDETRAIHQLNERIARDDRVENVLLTVRDGINLVRKLP